MAQPLRCETLVLVYAQRRYGEYELLGARMSPLCVSPGPPCRVGGVSEVGGVGGARDSYRQALTGAVFCYLVVDGSPPPGSAVVAYSMGLDGSLACRAVGRDDPGFVAALQGGGTPGPNFAGSDEVCPSRPGAKFEVSYTCPVVTYVSTSSGELVLHGETSVPCGRARLSRWVGPSDYEHRGGGGAGGAGEEWRVNAGISCFRDYVVSARMDCVRTCVACATVVVVRPGGPRCGGGEMVGSYSERDICVGRASRHRDRRGGGAGRGRVTPDATDPPPAPPAAALRPGDGPPDLELPREGQGERQERVVKKRGLRRTAGGCSVSPPGEPLAVMVRASRDTEASCSECGMRGGEGGWWWWWWRPRGGERQPVRGWPELAEWAEDVAWRRGACPCEALERLPYASDEAMGHWGGGLE